MTQYSSGEEVRLELKRAFGQEPHAGRWKYLLERGWVEEVVEGNHPTAFDDLVDEYNALGLVNDPPTQPGAPERESAKFDRKAFAQSPDRYYVVLSEILALETANRAVVKSFRENHVGENVVAFEDIEEWITGKAHSDGPPAYWVKVPLDSQNKPLAPIVPDFQVDRFLRPVTMERLEYATPRGMCTQPLAFDGVLAYLRLVSRTLADILPWSPADAATFVVTGRIPIVEPIGVDFIYGKRGFDRIVLTIDLRTHAKSVSRLYEDIRKYMASLDLIATGAIPSRGRRLTDKHLELAKVGAMYIRGRKTTEPPLWRDLLEEWNEKHPKDWRYATDHLPNFIRDANAAYRKVARVLQ